MFIYIDLGGGFYVKKIKGILLLVVSLLFQVEVMAANLNVVYQSGIYGNKVMGHLTHFGQLGYIYLDGKIAYCLEPDKIIGSNYVIDSSVRNRFSQEDINYFTLVSYYGYNTTNHNNVYYYMATQELIWRKITGEEVYWTTESQTHGSRINIEQYKNEIITLVNNHNQNISFGNAKVRGNFRDVIVLEDKNNLLQHYSISNPTPNQVWKEGNKLYIKIMSSKELNVTLTRTFKNGTQNTYYSSGTDQSLAMFELNQTKTTTINVKAVNKYSMKLDIDFRNQNTKNNVKGKIKFKVKNLETNEYLNNGEIFETTDTGNYKSDFYVEEGKYQIELVEVFPNYVQTEGTTFEIMEDSTKEMIHVDDYINEATGNIEIHRYFDMTEIGKNKIDVPNVQYEIYAKDSILDTENDLIYDQDQLISTIITDESGQAMIEDLPLGNYYIKEYLEDDSITKAEDTYNISLEYQDDQTTPVISKLQIETKPGTFHWYQEVEEHKINCVNNNCEEKDRDLENIEYGIYAKEDIVVNEEIIFKKDELIQKEHTNLEGKIDVQIPLLKGEYEIKELTDMSKYEETFENTPLRYDEQSKLQLKVIKTIREQKFLDALPNTINKYMRYYLLCIGLFIISMIKVFYDKKKN